MKVKRAYRYELDPNVQQRILLAKHAGAARFAYNWGLARRITLYQETGQSTNAMEQHRELNRLKKTEYRSSNHGHLSTTSAERLC